MANWALGICSDKNFCSSTGKSTSVSIPTTIVLDWIRLRASLTRDGVPTYIVAVHGFGKTVIGFTSEPFLKLWIPGIFGRMKH